MTSRIRFLITAAFVCHLLAAPALVTSQLRSDTTPSISEITQSPPLTEEVTIKAVNQEKAGSVFKLRGEVEIHYLNYVFRGDEVTYNQDTQQITADGHILLEGGVNNERLQARHATYNLRTETGEFDDVTGTIGVQLQGSKYVLTSSNPFYFSGKKVEKTGPDRFVVHGGTVTTCQLPRPIWQFSARKVTVDVGGDARIYHSAFLIEGIPILYLPFATHPVQPQRRSGFLPPTLGNSSRKGYIFGETVYWAINRSMDATLGADYFSDRGWSPQGEFRARPSEKSFFDLSFLAVLDRGFGPDRVDQGGANVRLKAESIFPHDFRGVADIDYLSSYVFRLAFNETFTQAVYSEVKSQAFLSKSSNGFSINGLMQRYQNFESTEVGDVITILHAPSFEAGGVDRKIGSSPLFWSFDIAAGGLSRSEPDFRTGQLVGRLDVAPSLSLPLQLHGWAVRPELTLRDTYYSQRLMPSNGVGVAADDPINRRALEGTIEFRPPALHRVFDGEIFGRKWKHVIEPRVVYRYVTGIDHFQNILRFDSRDVLSNTNEIEYSLVNRVYGKRVSDKPEDCGPEGMPSSLLLSGEQPQQSAVPWQTDTQKAPCSSEPRVRQVIRWELAQKYFIDPTFGGALVPGRRNVFTTTSDLTGIAFLTGERRLSPLISRLNVQTSTRTDAEWELDYDFKVGGINASTVLVNYRIGAFTLGAGDAYLRTLGEGTDDPSVPRRFNQFRLLFGYGYPNKRGFSGALTSGFDATLNFLQYGAIQTTYNWNCCGISAEYRRFNLGSIRNENQFRFTFALANIGAFGNLSRHERLF